LINADYTDLQTLYRRVDLSQDAGKAISQILLDTEGYTSAGQWNIVYGEITLVGADGTVHPLFTTGQTSVSLQVSNTSGVSGISYWPAHYENEAIYPQVTTTYYHSDHVGSSRLLTNWYGYPTWSGTFLPFGQEWSPEITTNTYKFTGKERDSESGLDNFGARYDSSQYGRFMTPDPVKISLNHLSNPQKWNKYAYVLNNPLSMFDPDGKQEVTITYRAFIPQANVGYGPFSGRGDNRTFSTQANASSRVSVTMHIETDPSKNGGNPLIGKPEVKINTTHNNLTGHDTPAVVVQAPTVTATQDSSGNVNLNLQLNVHSGDLPASMSIRSDVNIGVNETATQGSVNGTVSGSPAFETNFTPDGALTTNLPVQSAPSGTIDFLGGLLKTNPVSKAARLEEATE
jgi:RHS repeat-associated protein